VFKFERLGKIEERVEEGTFKEGVGDGIRAGDSTVVVFRFSDNSFEMAAVI
jgi:hypothetical protein